jgi:hypothetical protein
MKLTRTSKVISSRVSLERVWEYNSSCFLSDFTYKYIKIIFFYFLKIIIDISVLK